MRKETRCRHIGYSYRLTARILLYAPSHRQDNTYHGLCYTSCGALAGTRNSSMGLHLWLCSSTYLLCVRPTSSMSDHCEKGQSKTNWGGGGGERGRKYSPHLPVFIFTHAGMQSHAACTCVNFLHLVKYIKHFANNNFQINMWSERVFNFLSQGSGKQCLTADNSLARDCDGDKQMM